MKLLVSNFPPVKTTNPTYGDAFYRLLSSADEVNLATGYVSEESLADLKATIELHGGPRLNLHVGMHLFDGISQNQHNGLLALNNYLQENKLGGITVSQTFPFHGKASSFLKDANVIGAIVGSSNLSNIVSGNHRQYEIDYLISPEEEAVELNDLIEKIILVLLPSLFQMLNLIYILIKVLSLVI
jgi:hypothetical protein